VLERARKLDRKERIEPEKTITFESPLDFLEVVTEERVRLCKAAREQNYSVTALAKALDRNPRAVRTDIRKLQKHGLLRLRKETNPGHGTRQIVEAVAKKFKLRAHF
jgi:predicted transcriptional regulator